MANACVSAATATTAVPAGGALDDIARVTLPRGIAAPVATLGPNVPLQSNNKDCWLDSPTVLRTSTGSWHLFATRRPRLYRGMI